MPRAASNSKSTKSSKSSEEPEVAYQKIALKILERLDSNEWPPGSLLPSVRALGKEFKVGYFTVWMAVNALKKEGRIEATKGNKTEAARRLGVTARTLSNKMKLWRELGLVA